MDLLDKKIPLPPGVRAIFTLRSGGVSDPPFHSFNLSVKVGDDRGAAHENRMRLASNLPAEPMWLCQAHGNRVLRADEVVRDADVADASHTRSKGVVCAVQTADCLPVLFFHEDGSGVGAAHAGWRGLASGVLENTAAAMRAENDAPLHACIGPAISPRHYVVGAEVRAALISGAGSAAEEDSFLPSEEEPGKWHADLQNVAVHRLRAAGVTALHRVRLCTYASPKLLFSARRDGGKTGRQAAVIYRT